MIQEGVATKETMKAHTHGKAAVVSFIVIK